MYLYNLTLQKASCITHAVHGNFSGAKYQEIAVGRGKVLELLRPDPNSGKVQPVLSVEIFGVIRSLLPFRLTGGTKDYLIVGSDSGRIVILEYNPAKNVFDKVHQETFGKSGCRRIVPGQYLAIDPKGRAVMIGALEKQKFVYILNRDSAARLTISSPLEAHKSHTIVYSMVGVDVGFENPMFACLELDYEDADTDTTGEAAQAAQQTLTFYELDLGLNHVVRKYSEPLEDHGNLLIPVPGGGEGPSGVLICSENYITYKNFGEQEDIRCPIPRRRNDLDDAERGMLFVCSATHKTKTEQGDIFKITLETSKEEDLVSEIRLKYFDTVPVASAMCVLRTGFLFVASEFGNHAFYQIAHLGDDDDEVEFSSAMALEEGETFHFAPRGLKNLMLVDEIENLSPVMSCQIADLTNEDTPQLYVACGRGPRSSLRVLRHGLEVSEMAVSELPGHPNAVWTVKQTAHDGFFVSDDYDSYIVVSFVNATLVLSIGETVEEVTDTGFLGTAPTLSCSQLGDDALVQVYPGGIRHIRSDRRVNEWKAPGRKSIVKCAVNERQVVIAMSGGELVYFEMDMAGQLNEYTERKEMSADVVCMALGRVPGGEQRCRFVAVGLSDNTVRIISLDPADCLQPLSMQALPAPPESLCLLEMGGSGGDAASADLIASVGGLFLNIGLQNGVLLRTVLDSVTGDLSDTRARYLGSRPVKLFQVKMQGTAAMLALSSRSWLSYTYQSRFHLTPLSYDALEFASSFSSEQCPEGIVAISTNTLRILGLEKLGAVFNQVAMPLQYTPRKFVIHPTNKSLVIIETDHNALTEKTKVEQKRQIAEVLRLASLYPLKLIHDKVEEAMEDNVGDAIVEVDNDEDHLFDVTYQHFSVLKPVLKEVVCTLERVKEDHIEKTETYLSIFQRMVSAAPEHVREQVAQAAEQFLSEDLPEVVFSAPKPGLSMWASAVRVVDPAQGTTMSQVFLEQNVAAYSVAVCQFSGRGGTSWHVLVGTAKDVQLQPRRCAGGEVMTYKMDNDSKRLNLLHTTPVEDIPSAIHGFQGRVLIGVGKLLRLYDMGRKKLLRKCENKHIPNFIVSIQAMGYRIVVGDVQESFHYVKYRPVENQLVIFADDTNPRWVTSCCLADYSTVVGSDKFGNVAVMRLHEDVNDDVDEDPTGTKSLWDRGLLSGASQKVDIVCNYHVGETIVSLQKTTLVPGGSECIVYTTMSGGVGILVPFTSREDIDFFQHLEMHMRQEHPPLCGRDHLHYRSYYFPCKNVIDGDLCEQFNSIEPGKRRSIAEDLDRTPSEVAKKLEDIRTRFAF